MIKKAYTEKRISCIYRDGGSTIKHCKDCSFFNGFVKDGKAVPEDVEVTEEDIEAIDCLRGDIAAIYCHVTSFTMGEYEYHTRHYDEDIDGEIEGDDPYDFCQKCCFSKTLINGREICTLRCGTSGNEQSNFICYEGEIWVKEKRTDIDED